MAEAISFEQHWDRRHQFDPPELFAALQKDQPLVGMTYPDGHRGWLVTGHELARQVLADPRFSHRIDIAHFPVTRNGQPIPPLPIMPGMFIHMDPPDHARYRRLLTGEFTLRRMNQLQPRVEDMAARQLDALRAQQPPADLLSVFVRPLVLGVMADLLGLSAEEAEKLAEYPDAAHEPEVDVSWATDVMQQTVALTDGFIARKRDEPGDDITSRLIASGDLTDEELRNILLLLFIAGFTTTEGALAVSVFALLHHTGQLAALREHSQYDRAVEELLRYVTVNQYEIFRAAKEDAELGGEVVGKGETVTISLPAANRDPAKFSAPETLDITRDAAGHLAFGHGVHQCLGQHLGRIVLKAGLSTLIHGLPGLRLAVPAAEVPLRTKTSVYNVRSLPVSW